MRYEAIVMGMSAGGIEALKLILPALPPSFPLPIMIAQHRDEHSGSFLSEYLNDKSGIQVSEAEDKEPLCAGRAYLAPAGYHLLIESDRCLSLSVDPRVNHACPSIDVLFESAADAFGKSLIGIVLTGANADGAQGLKAIKARGGLAIVQNPEEAKSSAMPRAALKAASPDYIVELTRIVPLLMELSALQEDAGEPVS
jgi:two-component system chemotaxis response regulator CheB